MPEIPYERLDREFLEYKRNDPSMTFARYFMEREARGVKEGGKHHSLGHNLRGADGETVSFWEAGARKAGKIMRSASLKPDSRVIEYGCGSLRMGAHFIRYLDRDCFWGLDVVSAFYEIGRQLIGPDLLHEKSPRFDVIEEPVVAEAEKFGADLVFSSAVCVHVHPDEAQGYFRNLSRLCRKPGARLIFDAVLSETTLRYGHRSWARPLDQIVAAVPDLGVVQVSRGNEHLKEGGKITLAMLEFSRT
jgi:SAM-dependent methyltransferase